MGAARETPAAEGTGLRAGLRAAALIAYFDTSAIVKLLVYEDDSEVAEELWRHASERTTSLLAYPEARAALVAAERSGRITSRALRRAVSDLDDASAALRLIGIDVQLARTAGELAERHSLRGYDAVHLASALSIDDSELVLLTWDGELARAASACGRPVAPASG